METKLPMYQQGVHQEASPTAPGSGYQPYQANAQQLEVQHHGERNDDANNQQSEKDSDIILPIDPGDVPQQRYLSVSHRALQQVIPTTVVITHHAYTTHTA